MRQDLRYAFVQLAKRPVFATVAILTLALGIGANTSMFSVVHHVLLAKLPYPAPDELQLMTQTFTSVEGSFQIQDWSYPEYEAFRNSLSTAAVAAYTPYTRAYNLATPDDAARAQAEIVSASYFDILGVPPARGRTFTPDEDTTPGTHAVAVISDGLWRSALGGDPAVVGSTIRLDGVGLEVTGVMPPGFKGLSGEADVWVPMMMAPTLVFSRRLEQRQAFWHSVVARVPDADVPRAAAELAAASRALTSEFAATFGVADIELGTRALADASRDRPFGRALLILFAAVACVLLIACVNLANLLLARGVQRSRELGLRLALGASRSRLLRQLLTEAALLSAIGAVAAIGVAALALELLRSFDPGLGSAPGTPPRFGISLAVLVFNFCVAIGTALAFGAVPALAASRQDPRIMLNGGKSAPKHAGPRGALVVAEVALATVLLICAGLLLRSLDRLEGTPLGFEPGGVLTAWFNIPSRSYSPEEAVTLFTEAKRRIASQPSVEQAAIANCLPATPNGGCDRVEMRVQDEAGVSRDVWMNIVSPDYFSTMRIPVLEGRTLDRGDDTRAPRVAVVTQAAADRYWPGRDPIGARIRLSAGSDEWLEVVGVAGDTIGSNLREPAEPGVFLPYPQFSYWSNYLVVRSGTDAGATAALVRSVLLELDRSLPLWDVATMDERLSRITTRDRFSAVLLGAFGVLALLLAAVGIYGVLAFLVAERTREVGLRIAIGASQNEVSMLVLRQGLRFVLLGLAVGVVLSLAVTQVLESQLHGVSPLDPATFISAALILISISALACLQPAYRAARIDPMAALRHE